METAATVDNRQERMEDVEAAAVGAAQQDPTQVEDKHNLETTVPQGPMKILKPLRTDAVKALQSRQRRLERLSAVKMPELHYVGQIVSGNGIVLDGSEGACCRYYLPCSVASHPPTLQQTSKLARFYQLGLKSIMGKCGSI